VKPDSRSAREVLLVGSVGLKNSEEVFRAVGPLLGPRMRRMPDGETGPRTSWVARLRFVLENYPAFEDDPREVAAGGRITHPTEGTRTWKGSAIVPRGAPPPPRLRLRAGMRPQDIRIGRLGYPDAAIDGKIFNAGYENHKLIEIAEMVRNVVGKDVQVVTTATDDLRSYHICSDKIKRELGWAPTHTIEDAVRDLCRAFLAGKVPNPDGGGYYNVRTLQATGLK